MYIEVRYLGKHMNYGCCVCVRACVCVCVCVYVCVCVSLSQIHTLQSMILDLRKFDSKFDVYIINKSKTLSKYWTSHHTLMLTPIVSVFVNLSF